MANDADLTTRRLHSSERTDDRALIAAIANGDERALRAIYDRDAPWLAARLRRLLPAHAVEDVLQETFLAIWHGAARFQGTGDAGAWCWGIARRQAALWQRRNGQPVVPFDEALLEARSDPAHEAVVRIDVQQAFAAAGRPGSPGRDLARRAFVNDQPIAEIARDLDIPAGTVKSRIHALRRTIRQSLGKEVAS